MANSQNQAMQRFFEFVFNVPGDCFCCTWSISCFLETVEHMEGDKRWRSICTLGMSLLSLIIVFLLSLALCPKFYWSEINQIIMTNSTVTTSHLNYTSTYLPTNFINITEYDLLQSPPINDLDDDHNNNRPHNTTIHSVTYQHIGLHLNLWHINYCTKNESNLTIYKTYYNQSSYNNDIKGRKFINNSHKITNQTCSFITYKESGTTSSTQDLSLWFIIFVITLLFLGSGCVLATHPIFDQCHAKNTTLRSTIQKILAIAITILCACILNWSSFVFAAVFEHQVEKYDEWQEKKGITQSNLGTGMLAVNGAMLLGIILSVIHCGAPIRTDLNNQNNQQQNDNDDNPQNSSNNSSSDNNESTRPRPRPRPRPRQLSHEQRMLLRRIPGGNSSMGNISILGNPDRWFRSNHTNNDNDNNASSNNNLNVNNSSVNSNGGAHQIIDIDQDDEFKEFEYQNMTINDKDDKQFNANLSLKRIRKTKKKKNEKEISLLNDNDDGDGNKNKEESDDVIVPKLTTMNVQSSDDSIE